MPLGRFLCARFSVHDFQNVSFLDKKFRGPSPYVTKCHHDSQKKSRDRRKFHFGHGILAFFSWPFAITELLHGIDKINEYGRRVSFGDFFD